MAPSKTNTKETKANVEVCDNENVLENRRVDDNIKAVSKSTLVEFGDDNMTGNSKNHDPLHNPVAAREVIFNPIRTHTRAKRSAASALIREEEEQRLAAALRRKAEAGPQTKVVDITCANRAKNRKMEHIQEDAIVNVKDAIVTRNVDEFSGTSNKTVAMSQDNAIIKSKGHIDDAKVDDEEIVIEE